MVGPFIFLDHMGPVQMPPGDGVGIRPHPHVNLATVTYLFEGEILHRDSIGSEQLIRPGAVNWMTAGRGIAHSERSPAAVRKTGARVHGLQLWVALPTAQEEVAPSFQHRAAESIPAIERAGARLRVVAGSAYDVTSPVEVLSPLFYVEAELDRDAVLALPDDFSGRAAYVVHGAVACDGKRYGDRGGAGPRHVDRRRAARRSAPHLVELRLEQGGADRAGETRLERGPVRGDPRGRSRAHPAAGMTWARPKYARVRDRRGR